jgi:hypothetical protein
MQSDGKETSIPMSTTVRFEKDQCTEDCPPGRETKFRSLIGSANFAARFNHPELTFAISYLSRFLNHPTEAMLKAAEQIRRYLRTNAKVPMVYSNKPKRDLAAELGIPFEHTELTAFTDASYACEQDTGRSRGGYVILWNGAAITWKSLIFKTVAISAAESEYMALAECSRQVDYVLTFIGEAFPEIKLKTPVPIWSDSQAAVQIANNPGSFRERSKHINVRYHYVRELIKMGRVKPQFMPRKFNIADVFTTARGNPQLAHATDVMRGTRPPE